jgi:ABC-type transport system involved in cytochrome bd biosynthesis fused ATPase/permease subunit
MNKAKVNSIEPMAEYVFKVVERIVVIGVLGFAVSHLEGAAGQVGAVIVAGLLFLASLALIEPLIGHAIRSDGKLSVRIFRGAALFGLASGVTFMFWAGFVAVLPFSG